MTGQKWDAFCEEMRKEVDGQNAVIGLRPLVVSRWPSDMTTPEEMADKFLDLYIDLYTRELHEQARRILITTLELATEQGKALGSEDNLLVDLEDSERLLDAARQYAH